MAGFYDRRTICGFQVSLNTHDLEVELLRDTPAVPHENNNNNNKNHCHYNECSPV
uniref:Uncharacterized protein n=1 Tax=Mustela putorius furo TaxID=9669 RepID=M3XRS4_MUSPF